MASVDSSAGSGGTRAERRLVSAAAVLLVRRSPRLEIYWVERSPLLAYLGGFHAFPGGRVDRDDVRVPVTGVDDALEAQHRAGAARELFEEAGVLLAGSGGRRPPRPPRFDERAQARAELIAGSLSFADFLLERGLAVEGALLHPAGRWISPPFAPRGFDTRFYLAACPAGEVPYVIPGELTSGEWVEPARGYAAWERGELLAATPVKSVLLGLAAMAGKLEEAASGGGWEERLARSAAHLGESPESRGGPIERVEVRPGVVLVPLASATIPPATHTNCYIIGEGECLIVDPGSAAPGEQAELTSMLERLAAAGRRPVAITVTHAHGDHTAGVEAVRRALGVPVWAHPLAADALGADRALADGEVLALAGANTAAWNLEVLFTPGHTRDHVALLERNRGVLIAGDLVSGLSTVVLDPPEGDLTDYLASLRRLMELPARSLFPGHGPPGGGARERLAQLVEHRLWREGRVLEELRGGAATLEELLPRVYEDTPVSQWRWARRSLLAHLLALEKQRRVEREGESWRGA